MPQPAEARGLRPLLCACGAGIVAATLAAYANCLGGPFLYDDVDSILGNPSIRHLSSALVPPSGLTVSGRPVLNFSFAVNYAVSGTAVWSYHALNVAIHCAAALLLFGIVRRSLAAPAAGPRTVVSGMAVAFAAALLWALHPLQTESVAYTVQRAESPHGILLPADPLRLHTLRGRGNRLGRLGCAGRGLVSPRHGNKGGDGDGAAHGPSL